MCAEGERKRSMRRSPNRAGIGLLIALGFAMAFPAAAQVTFGSPADPPRIAIGGGAFDVLPNRNRAGTSPTGLALAEYRFGDVLWIVAPFVGVFGTGQGAFYGYGGFGFDINFFERVVFTPTAAGGFFTHGPGRDVGAYTQFRPRGDTAHPFQHL